MTPKFNAGDRVQNQYLGVLATVEAVLEDYSPPRYDLKYDGMHHTCTAAETVLTADITRQYAVDAICSSLMELEAMVQSATSARILGVFTSYGLERIMGLVDDAKRDLYQRASLPTEYL